MRDRLAYPKGNRPRRGFANRKGRDLEVDPTTFYLSICEAVSFRTTHEADRVCGCACGCEAVVDLAAEGIAVVELAAVGIA